MKTLGRALCTLLAVSLLFCAVGCDLDIPQDNSTAAGIATTAVTTVTTTTTTAPTTTTTKVTTTTEATDTRQTTVKTTEATQKVEAMVWIPQSGTKYHSRSSCSNMKNPMHVSLSTAVSQGYTPCKKCC